MDLIEIGERVREARRGRGWTQTQLSQASDVSRARIDALENGRAAEFGFNHLGRILESLGMDLRLTERNKGRPTMEDLMEEGEDDAPRMGR